MTASRRRVLAGAIALAAAGPAPAAERLVDPKKVFPFLDAYLRIPPGRRSHFTVAYRLTKTRPAGLWLVEGQQRTPVPVASDGRLLRLPTAEQLEHAQLAISGPDKAKYGVGLSVEPLATMTQEMDAASLAMAVTQAGDGMKTAAGALSFVTPHLKSVVFRGVASGEAIYADGRRAPLPLVKGAPSFEPARHPGALRLRFPQVPSSASFG